MDEPVISAAFIKQVHNNMNATSAEHMTEQRKAFTLFAETLLEEVDQYRGFSYTSVTDSTRLHLY